MNSNKLALQIITTDMVLNWFLGFVLTLLPLKVVQLLMVKPIFSPAASQVCMVSMGVMFLLFAAWQMGLVTRGVLIPRELKFAAFMAWWPVVALTITLLLPIPLKPIFRVLLWSGNVYMLLLGFWYWWASKRV